MKARASTKHDPTVNARRILRERLEALRALHSSCDPGNASLALYEERHIFWLEWPPEITDAHTDACVDALCAFVESLVPEPLVSSVLARADLAWRFPLSVVRYWSEGSCMCPLHYAEREHASPAWIVAALDNWTTAAPDEVERLPPQMRYGYTDGVFFPSSWTTSDERPETGRDVATMLRAAPSEEARGISAMASALTPGVAERITAAKLRLHSDPLWWGPREDAPPEVEELRPTLHTLARWDARALILVAEALRDVQTKRAPAIAVDAGLANETVFKSFALTRIDHSGALESFPLDDSERYQGFKIIFDDGKSQLSLPLDGVNDDIVSAIRRALGNKGPRHWAAILHLFSVGSSREGSAVWRVSDHMDAMGYSRRLRADQALRDETVREVATFARMHLDVYDVRRNGHAAPGEQRIRQALLLEVNSAQRRQKNNTWSVEGMRLVMHPAIWNGVRDTNTGRLGNNHFPASPQLPTLHHNKYPHALIGGLRLPQRLRRRWGEEQKAKRVWDHSIRLTGEHALALFGIPQTREHHSGRAWETFDANVDALQGLQMQGMGEVKWNGEPHNSKSTVDLYAADWMIDRTVRRLPPNESKPAQIPTTGAELRAWREGRNMTQPQLAGALEVTDRTVQRAEAGESKALPPSIRSALLAGKLPGG